MFLQTGFIQFINKDPKPCSLICSALACKFNTLPGQLEKNKMLWPGEYISKALAK